MLTKKLTNVDSLGSALAKTQQHKIIPLTIPMYDKPTFIINNKWPTHPSGVILSDFQHRPHAHIHARTSACRGKDIQHISHYLHANEDKHTRMHTRVVGTQLSLSYLPTEGGAMRNMDDISSLSRVISNKWHP